ncbi:hypothetical protein IFM89_009075 [Coptis chinensis]|uniref:Uncharacterized protein n=1 Tax=Coptis chinensis TaxID=261450 RepID=A0A835M4W2_9MAGN|nr:hypothetical protein IFM89_009075 [Coptis chinensis]
MKFEGETQNSSIFLVANGFSIIFGGKWFQGSKQKSRQWELKGGSRQTKTDEYDPTGLFQMVMAVLANEIDDNWRWFLENLKLVVPCDRSLHVNVGLFQMVMAVLANEIDDNWRWFLENLKLVVPCDRRYEEMCFTLAECFNVWIKEERFMSVTAMLYHIHRIKMMKMFDDRCREYLSWRSELCPLMESVYRAKVDVARSFRVVRSNEVEFELYSHSIHPIANIEMPMDMLEYCDIMPPDVRRGPGRPKKKRIESTGASRRRVH